MADQIAAPKLTRDQLVELLAAEFPEATHAVGDYDIEEVWRGGCRVRRRHHESSLRPGGTVSGPIMMALADFTMYLAVLSAIGWVPLAVTTISASTSSKSPVRAIFWPKRDYSSSANGLRSARWRCAPTATTNLSPMSRRPIRSLSNAVEVI
jgi:hypothetical protein